LASYWAKALAAQEKEKTLTDIFKKVSAALQEKELQITNELLNAQCRSQDIGGYYKPDPGMISAAMRPSESFNQILDQIP
jgi:isocitrate dehydrogenase